MLNKIIEKVLEPSKIYTGSNFLLKVKATRYLTCKEAKTKACSYIKQFTCGEVKGI